MIASLLLGLALTLGAHHSSLGPSGCLGGHANNESAHSAGVAVSRGRGRGPGTGTGLPVAAERIRNEPESVWVEFVQLALEHKPLNLGQGFPDFAAPAYLVESLQNASSQVDAGSALNHQYTRPFGHPRLVRALRDYYRQWRNFNQLRDEHKQVLVTVGAYEALFAAIMAFVNPGDEALIVDPAFDAYAPMVAMAGGRAVFVPLRLQLGPMQNSSSSSSSSSLWAGNESAGSLSSGQFGLDMGELRAKISNRTRLLVLNTPNNPLGKVFSRQELGQLAALCIEHNILVLADEVYEQLYYSEEDHPPADHEHHSHRHQGHVSIASLPGMWQRTITVGSAGKTFSVTGWKIGWALGPAELIRYMQLVHQTAVYTVATPLQEAVARALEREMELLSARKLAIAGAGAPVSSHSSAPYWVELRQELRVKRDRMAAKLAAAQMRPIIPQGGYFMLADFSQLAKRHPAYKTSDNTTASDDYKFARWLARSKHLQTIPGSAFYSAQNKPLGFKLIRLCFIKSADTLARFEQLIDQLLAS